MGKFVYKAKAGPKNIVEGTVEADNEDDAVFKVMQLGYTPVDVSGKEAAPKTRPKRSIKAAFDFSKKVSAAEIALFTRQAGDLIDAGIPVLRVLSIIGKQTKRPYFKTIIAAIHNSVQDGSTLSDALAVHPHVFSKLYVNMVRSGEVGGNLNQVLNRLADFLEKDLETRSQIVSSLLYPGLILVFGTIVIFVLMTWVIPQITSIFDDLSEALPLPTLILIGISDFLSKFWWIVVGLVSLGIFYANRLYNTSHGKLWFDRMKLKLPILGNFIYDAEIGRFARTLGTLLDSGVVVISALESVSLVMQNEVLRQDIEKASLEVSDGASLTESLQKASFFPETATNMISVGEETGRTEEGLLKLANYYDRQSQKSMKRITSLLEPIMILVMGTIVGFIVIAMLLPMFRMNLIVN